MRAYAAVVYLVSVTSQGTDVSFVAAKTRVCPLQPVTVPSLELLSAVLLTRLINTVRDSLCSTLQQVNIQCSMVALYWICGVEKDWKPFVKNRVTEIRDSLTPDCGNHCSGKTNHADLPFRGISLSELSVSNVGPTGYQN